MRGIGLILFIFLQQVATAQYAPQAGLAGSTAISASSSLFMGWASHCTVQRGYIDIANPPAGFVTAGDSASATGPANGSILSLGDSGIAVLTFNSAIYNGPGADFAVFENGFRSPTDSALAFLELAFVEVSSDGSNFFRFPATCNVPTNIQIPGSGVYTDASLINNLAGKYISMYGTPFDLDELNGTVGLDVNNITHVRFVDVVGSITAHSGLDHEGKVINDPYPTNFPTGGFDLDAVGAIHLLYNGITPTIETAASIFPNPATDCITITLNGNAGNGLQVSLTSITGAVMLDALITATHTTLSLQHFPTGMYYLIFSDTNGRKWAEKIIKY